MPAGRALIIDDEEGVRTSLGLLLGDEGYEVTASGEPEAALDRAREEHFDVVLCDVRMPERSGLDLLPELIAVQPDATVIVMSAFGDVDQALASVRLGAFDYLSKPFQGEELLLCIRKAQERERLQRENRRLKDELSRERGPSGLMARSDAMREVHELVEQAARYKTTALVTGESGAGKEVVARAIHALSDRADEPFIAVNCGAIPEALMESELFGHARGAFTGASSDKRGLFREADGGTLFLDEVGELPAPVQVKLLRVLQEEEVRPVGEAKAIRVDVRIVAATARDLELEVDTGRFRKDLFYRLNVFRVHVPPLRERPEDIAALADALVRSISERLGKPVRGIEADALARLREYGWPGNVRELENTLERAVILARSDRIGADLLPLGLEAQRRQPQAAPAGAGAAAPQGPEDLSIKRRTRSLEERLIRLALAQTGGNRTQAARILEISLRALGYKIKEYAVEPLNPLSAPTDTDV